MFAILFFVLGLAQQGQAAMPVLARASSIADQIIQGARRRPWSPRFNNQLKAALPEERLQQVGTSLTAQAGAFQQQTGLRLARGPVRRECRHRDVSVRTRLGRCRHQL